MHVTAPHDVCRSVLEFVSVLGAKRWEVSRTSTLEHVSLLSRVPLQQQGQQQGQQRGAYTLDTVDYIIASISRNIHTDFGTDPAHPPPISIPGIVAFQVEERSELQVSCR
jgi:hypothetical protein